MSATPRVFWDRFKIDAILPLIGIAMKVDLATRTSTAPRFEACEGVPTAVRPLNSIMWRVDAPDSDTLLYRNTDGGSTWEAIVGAELTDLLAAANTWSALQTFSAHALLQDASALKFGTPGTDAVFTPDGTDLIVTGTGDIVLVDNFDFYVGTGKDLRRYHDGTHSYDVSGTGNWIRDNTNATGHTYDDLGTDTSATSWGVRNNSGSMLLEVDGGGGITQHDGTTLQRKGRGIGTGDVIERIGLTSTEGHELVVFEATVSPAAVETAILTVPANSRVRSVQANCEAQLTGGGTTVTWSVGTAADPDKYGTAAGGDTLAKNSKLNFIPAYEFLTSPEAIVLTGAATGGAADGNTALTVGSVRVRVIYETLNSLDDAA